MRFCNSPVFIIASERSGTNLLRKRITDSQAYYLGPSPAHFLKHLYYQEPYYGDLAEDNNFLRFIQQALDLCTVHFSPWDISWSADDVLIDYGDTPRGSILLMHYFMSRYSQENGYESYISKDNYIYEFALDIAEMIPHSKFIYLYRDPRDFVASQMKRPGSSKSPIKISRLWSYEQLKSIKTSESLSRKSRCVSLSYEEFICNEIFWINEICGYLGVSPSGKGNYNEKEIERVHEWENLDKPTISDNRGKYLVELSETEIKQVEAVCNIYMKYLGYEREYKEITPLSRYSILLDDFKSLIRRKVFSEKRPSGSIYEARAKVIGKMKINYRSDC